MTKQKNLSPLEMGHLKKYIDNQWCTLQELSVEMGTQPEVLESYIQSLGGLNLPEPPPAPDELTPSQQRVREAFATRAGAVIMTEGAAGNIEELEKAARFGWKAPNPKQESAIFRGNKPLGAKGNPYTEPRI